jgi:hypothetical protein
MIALTSCPIELQLSIVSRVNQPTTVINYFLMEKAKTDTVYRLSLELSKTPDTKLGITDYKSVRILILPKSISIDPKLSTPQVRKIYAKLFF